MGVSARLTSYMEENGVPYSVMNHASAYTAQGVASTLHVRGKALAKAVVLRVGRAEETILAVERKPTHFDI